jgi:hypothetical protein
MAARDADFYNYLKEALKNKVRYPEATSFRAGKYFFDYDYIFQQARRVLPQKYSISHSYLNGTPISYLDKPHLNQLNLEFAKDVIEAWGGLDEKQAEKKEVDSHLAEYEDVQTAPEEPDSFHQELEQNQLSSEPQPQEQEQQQQQEGPSQPSVPHPETDSPAPRVTQRPPAFTRQTEERLNRANQSMQRTGQTTASGEEPPQLSDRMSQRLNSATRSMRRPTPEGSIPRSRARAGRSAVINNRRRAAASLLRGAGSSSGFGIPWVPKFLSRWAGNLARGALNGLSRLASGLGRAAVNGLTRAAAQMLPRIGTQAALQAGRSLAVGALGVATSPLFLIYAAIIGTFFLGWLYSNMMSNSGCDKPGQMEVKKVLENIHSGDNDVKNGDQIDYQIQITYIWLCDKISLPSVTVTDTVPRSVEYVQDSAESGSPAYGPGPKGIYNEATRTITWNLTNISSNDPYGVYFSVKPFQQSDGTWSVQDSWLQNQATVTYRAPTSRSSGGFSDITGLLPNPLTPSPANWADIKAQVVAAYNKHPELLDMYKQAGSQTGVPWQILAGLHFVETGSGPGPDSSLVSGRKIGQTEPDVSPVKCAGGRSGPGMPVPLGGGCGFSNQLDSAIYAGNHLAEKIGKVPSTFPEVVEALSKYNGGGNANCGEGLDYGPCPPQFIGEDDPYAMADFDEAHSHDKMYVIFCADRTRCNPKRLFGRPGAMGVVRALMEEGL